MISNFLASYSDNHTVRVWDVSSGQCMQLFKSAEDMRKSFMDKPNVDLLDSTVGLASFGFYGPSLNTGDAYFDRSDYSITPDGRCITWNSECLLWLPPDYRPAESLNACVVSGSTLYISRASGQVYFFVFDSAVLSQALAHSDLTADWSLSST